ncbi:MAG: hypothetical protein WA091_02630, partial [Minisyncoccales bacterium]
MKIQKRHWFIIFSLLLLTLGIETYYYSQLLKIEDVEAVTVGIPNPGHSLAQLECSADSLCVDTTNNRVGIGTTAPIAKFQIGVGTNNSQSSVAAISANGGNSVLSALSLVNTYSGTLGNGVAIDFHNASNWSPTGRISLVQSGASITDSKLVFSTYNGSLLDRMTIDYLGNVGIGTANPIGKFVVKQGGAGWTDGINLERSTTTDRFNFTHDSSGRLLVGYNAADVMGIYSSGISIGSSAYSRTTPPSNGLLIQGNVGIGTTTADAKLKVDGGGFAIGDAYATSDIEGARRSIQITTDTSYGGTYNNHTGSLIYSTMPSGWGTSRLEIRHSTGWGTFATAPDMVIGSNVGIGTTSPGYTLTVAGTAWVTSGAWS